MNFPGNTLKRISHFFDGDKDEILIYVLVFLFILFTGRSEERDTTDEGLLEGGMPIFLIAAFLLLILNNGSEKQLA